MYYDVAVIQKNSGRKVLETHVEFVPYTTRKENQFRISMSQIARATSTKYEGLTFSEGAATERKLQDRIVKA